MILLAALAANLPFANERLFAVVPLRMPRKSAWLRLCELVILYALVILFARMIESRMGNAFEQKWEFYAVTACLFLVLGYPGFVYRYLRKQHA